MSKQRPHGHGRIQIYTLAGLLMLLSGCAPTSITPEPIPAPAAQTTEPLRPGADVSRPVVALLDQAREAALQGELGVAEAQLERALRIEPGNAMIWHYLAKLRLQQGRLDQAAGLAARSNSLEQHANRVLQADNWRIIAHARYHNGDLEGAMQAQQRAEALMNSHTN